MNGTASNDSVIVTCALTGGIHGKEANPNLPEQPDEIVEQGVAAWRAGASILHVHARNPDGSNTMDPDIYSELHERLCAETDAVIQLTTGGSPMLSVEERLNTVFLAPEMCSLNMGLLNFFIEQVRDLRRYAQTQGYAILGDPIEDDGYSGRTMNRPGLALVRELAGDGAFDVLLVAKWNRLFRRGAYQDLFIAEMKLAGVDVISLDGQKNDSPAGKLFNRMMADFSEYQRDDLIETMQRGKRGRARQGKVIPSRFVPYGFSYDSER